MNTPGVKPSQPSPSREQNSHPPIADPQEGRKRVRQFAICALLLTCAFAVPLWQLLRHALATDIASHILLIPFISLYLWKTDKSPLRDTPRPSDGRGIKGEGPEDGPGRKNEVSNSPSSYSAPPAPAPRSVLAGSMLPAFLFGILGSAALAGYWIWGRSGQIPHNDALALSTASYLLLLVAAALTTLGWGTLRRHWFAIAFLVFMIPLPTPALSFLSVTLQHFSADAADLMLALTGTPVFRDGMVFQLPGLAIRVAEECSGVRSTFVLFITSLLAGHLFLRSGWKKAFLALSIFPLGVIRNGFRITTISWLTINVNSGVIDSPLHHRGGPIFFVLSLFPLFALLWLLRRSDFRLVGPSSSTKDPMTSRLDH